YYHGEILDECQLCRDYYLCGNACRREGGGKFEVVKVDPLIDLLEHKQIDRKIEANFSQSQVDGPMEKHGPLSNSNLSMYESSLKQSLKFIA
ncbi:hypothetical protein J6590_072375, partial [Homalodisca vitripennis]